MPIPLSKDLVGALIKKRYGSVDGLVVEWEERLASGVMKAGRARNRTTIYRWIDNGMPSRPDGLFGLAGLLAVDPVALLNIDETYIQANFGRERRSFQMGGAIRTPLMPLWSIYAPSPVWPNAEIAATYFKHPWFTHDFTHHASEITDVYAAVHLTSEDADDRAVPRVYHFAYRRLQALDDMWRPYGTVIGEDGQVRLISESGDYQSRADARSNDRVAVETHFGSGPAAFRLASTHAFGLQIVVPPTENAAVRFVA